jgi:hypothetical protein
MEKNADTQSVQVQQVQQLPVCHPCDNTVEFCTTIVVPPHFEYVPNECNSTGIDTSCLQCVLEPCTVQAQIKNPCDPTKSLHCPVEINAVRAIGCITFYATSHFKNTINNSRANFCSKGTVCVDNIICYVCADDDNPCSQRFFSKTVASKSTAKQLKDHLGKPITTCDGHTIWELRGTITLPSC